MRRVLDSVLASISAVVNSFRYLVDVNIVLMVLKGSVTAFCVSWTLSLFSGIFVNHWFGNYIELIHELFALIAFTISCILDLRRYWSENHKEKQKGKQKGRKNNR